MTLSAPERRAEHEVPLATDTITRWRFGDLIVSLLGGILVLAVYVRGLAPGLLWGDSAEFQFAAFLGGFAHPTGYPLYLLLGWLWSHIVPLGDVAYRMNLFSAVWGGVGAAVFALAVMASIRLIGRAPQNFGPRIIGFASSLVYAFTPAIWSQAVVAEVYTLHAAFVAAILLALVTWASHVIAGDPAGAMRYAVWSALLVGLSLSHHRSTLLLLPGAALFVTMVWRGRPPPFRQQPRQTIRRGVTLALCVLAPLLSYLYIPLAAAHAPYSQLTLTPNESLTLYEPTLRGFLYHVTGSGFGGSLRVPSSPEHTFGALLSRFTNEVSVEGIVLAILGLAWLVIRGVTRRDRATWAIIALTLGLFVAQVAFNLFYAIGDIYVFYIPAYLILVLWEGVGAWATLEAIRWVLSGLQIRSGIQSSLSAFVAAAVLFALAAQALLIRWPQVQRASDQSARTTWEAVLSAPLQSNGVLVTNDRDEMVPFWYLKYVERREADLAGLFPLIQPGEQWATVARVTERALSTGRPVYLLKPMPGLETRFVLGEPLGMRVGSLGPIIPVLSTVNPAGASISNLVFDDTVRLQGYELTPATWRAAETVRFTLWWEPLQSMGGDWTTFVQVYDSAGAKVGQSDHLPGGEYNPSGLWRRGELLRDEHAITLAGETAPGSYRVTAGLYMQSDTGLRRLGEPQTITEVVAQR